MPKILTMPLKGVYFNQIKSGEKVREFRLVTPFWEKRLVAQDYEYVTVTLGYPRRDNTERRMTFKWSGYERQTITHEHFGPDAVEVFAIRLPPHNRVDLSPNPNGEQHDRH